MPAGKRVLLPLVVRFIIGLIVAAGLGVWLLPFNTMTPPTMLICAALTAGGLGLGYLIAHGMSDVNAWVEFDGASLRWKSLLSGRVRARPAAEILDVRRHERAPWGAPTYDSPLGPAFLIELSEGATVRVDPDDDGAPQLIAALQSRQRPPA
jgi:hypothetical protein